MDFNHDRVEARSVAFTDIDASSDGGKFTGYAAVFDAPADLGAHTESVNRGAFRKSLSNGSNVPMLYDHNPALPVLATTGAGTLKLKEDGKGLRVEADIARHFIGDAVREMVKRGEIRGMSFGFIAGSGNSKIEQRGGKPHRTLTGFKHLLDVSPTWNPAYVDTNAELRSLRAIEIAIERSEDPSSTLVVVRNEFRALTTGQMENTLEGLQSVAEAIEAALAQVGLGDPDEPGDTEDVTTGPISDEQYVSALETIASLLESAEGLLEGAGIADPDAVEDAAEGRTTPAPDEDTPDGDVVVEEPVEEEQRSGVEPVDETAAAARRRKLQLMGMSFGAS